MRSRWPGSMLAWILNTKPVSAGSSGSTTRWRATRGSGPGASATNAASSSSTPKLLIAEPKNTGVCRPARYAAGSNAWVAPLTSSISAAKASRKSPRNSRAAALASPSMVRFSPTRPRSPAEYT